MTILMVSRGTPMILAVDEILRTQHGNNNTWCQNNELSWFDWGFVETERDMLEFCPRDDCISPATSLPRSQRLFHW